MILHGLAASGIGRDRLGWETIRERLNESELGFVGTGCSAILLSLYSQTRWELCVASVGLRNPSQKSFLAMGSLLWVGDPPVVGWWVLRLCKCLSSFRLCEAAWGSFTASLAAG